MNSSSSSYQKAIRIHVLGRVQGVGFRPFVYRLANKMELKGYVYNQPDGVIIHLETLPVLINIFKRKLISEAPQAARIKTLEEKWVPTENCVDFKILSSQQLKEVITEICPDIGICPNCVSEIKTFERRINYPFINCTNCGPRFTIINDFPYDRSQTSMKDFEMCPDCQKEYTNPSDRRFHAQPVSCHECGPVYQYIKNDIRISDNIESFVKISEDINNGKIIAIKGIGGYNLACDAFKPPAINELRSFKNREKKPFAVMFRSIENIEQVALIDEKEKETLVSWQKPIVILKLKKPGLLSSEIISGLNSVGAFLPYMPIHFLIFEKIKSNAIILTSGNDSDTPIHYIDENAQKVFKNISGGILINNRDIVRRNDDSVVKIVDNFPRLIRRSRGYVPSPIDLDFGCNGIIAGGAELSNCFCIGKENQAILSQHIGDLKNAETYQFYNENISEFIKLYRIYPEKIACDLHPDYLSTRYAEESGLPVVKVQHHHAHIASCMAEYGLNEQVVGISYDGTGLGTDGAIWGSECMIADFTGFERLSHFEYFPLPGGDLVTSETWRSALSCLYLTFGDEWKDLDIPFLQKIDIGKAEKLVDAMDKGINSPMCCSAGRLFDAVAALLCICIESNYHAEAPMMMENLLNVKIDKCYSFHGKGVISFKSMFREIIGDIIGKKKLDEIVTKFHNTIALAALCQTNFVSENHNINKVVLSGGVFQNKFLTEKILSLLRTNHFIVYLPRLVPCNDGGIALGQLAIASHKI